MRSRPAHRDGRSKRQDGSSTFSFAHDADFGRVVVVVFGFVVCYCWRREDWLSLRRGIAGEAGVVSLLDLAAGSSTAIAVAADAARSGCVAVAVGVCLA